MTSKNIFFLVVQVFLWKKHIAEYVYEDSGKVMWTVRDEGTDLKIEIQLFHNAMLF